jgi:4-hydroxy-2-oxoheptanedioate aldolase
MAEIPRLNGAIRALEQGKPAFTAFVAPEKYRAGNRRGIVTAAVFNSSTTRRHQALRVACGMLDRHQILKSGSWRPVAPFCTAEWLKNESMDSQTNADIGVYGVVWPHISTVRRRAMRWPHAASASQVGAGLDPAGGAATVRRGRPLWG